MSSCISQDTKSISNTDTASRPTDSSVTGGLIDVLPTAGMEPYKQSHHSLSISKRVGQLFKSWIRPEAAPPLIGGDVEQSKKKDKTKKSRLEAMGLDENGVRRNRDMMSHEEPLRNEDQLSGAIRRNKTRKGWFEAKWIDESKSERKSRGP